ncbi:beta-galactosidase trimerization domain-containing protein, partial [Streptomyces seoulensis]|uniref:beta-galactosidase trimerization domain-containing protein n=1 Tax=Streptomyces seoulensis TaxID=73044 RepID=UPI0033A3DC7A
EPARLDDATLAQAWAERVERPGCSPEHRSADTPGGGPAAGGPAVTRHPYGRGSARYVATRPSARTLRELTRALAEEAGVRPVAAEGVEAVRRTGPQGSYLFLVNHTDDDVTVPVRGTGLLDAEVTASGALVPAGGVVVVREHE